MKNKREIKSANARMENMVWPDDSKRHLFESHVREVVQLVRDNVHWERGELRLEYEHRNWFGSYTETNSYYSHVPSVTLARHFTRHRSATTEVLIAAAENAVEEVQAGLAVAWGAVVGQHAKEGGELK
jgi:hypothetical protein